MTILMAECSKCHCYTSDLCVDGLCPGCLPDLGACRLVATPAPGKPAPRAHYHGGPMVREPCYCHDGPWASPVR